MREQGRAYLQKGAETVFCLSQVLQEYVRLVEDVETRLNLATKYKCHDVVIEVDSCGVKRWDTGLLFLSSFSVLCLVPLLSCAW